MSIQLVAWALETPCGSVSRKAVLLSLANCHNHHSGLCCPSLKRIAKETDLSVSTVQRALEALIEMGLVAKTDRQRGNGSKTSNAYTFPTTPYGHGDHSPLVTVTTPEPEVEPEVKPLAASPRKPPTERQRNQVWDALTDIFGAPTTRKKEIERGKVVAELTQAGATYEEVIRRAKAWPNHYDSATLTPHALDKHWDALGKPPLRRR